MSPTLQILSGPVGVGQKFEITKDKTHVGRHPDCEVRVDLTAASRFHARIHAEGGKFSVEDAGSRNGTFVNGKAIEGRVPLKDNDRLKICEVLFVFRDGSAAPGSGAVPAATPSGRRAAPPPPEEPEEEGSSTVLSVLDPSSNTDKFLRVRPEAKLRAVLEINQALASTLQVESIVPRILDSLFSIFPQADRGLFIQEVEGAGGTRLVPRAFKHRRANEDSVRFSKTIVRKVIDEKKAILSADAANDDRFNLSVSVADFRIRSVMCAPMVAPDGPVVGVLQLDTQSTTQKFEEEDLQILLSVAGQAAVALTNARLHEDALDQERVQRELELARTVQLGFLPRHMPVVAGHEFWAYYEAAGMVGGDYYDFVRLPNGKLAVLLGDVSGKGVPAALLMAKASSDAKVGLLSHPNSPVDAIGVLNTAICDAGLDGRFITLALCVMDPETHQMTIVNAGHMSPLVRRRGGALEEPASDEVSGVPIGVLEDYPYDLATTTLGPGEVMVIYSDGISEAQNVQEKLYGMDRLRGVIGAATGGESAEALGQRILTDVRQFVAGAKQNDDMTMVIVRNLG